MEIKTSDYSDIIQMGRVIIFFMCMCVHYTSLNPIQINVGHTVALLRHY